MNQYRINLLSACCLCLVISGCNSQSSQPTENANSGRENETRAQAHANIIHIDKDGSLSYAGKAVTLDTLPMELIKQSALSLSPHSATALIHISRVVEKLQAAGIKNIKIATKQPPPMSSPPL